MSSSREESAPNGLSYAERERMLMSVQKLIRAEVRRLGVPQEYHEDAEQDAQLVVWAQSAKFDPTRGVKFSTFATACIRRNLLAWKAKNEAYTRGIVLAVGGADYFDRLPDDRGKLPRFGAWEEADDTGISDEDGEQVANVVRRALYEGLLNKLAPGHRRLVEMTTFDGLTVEQVAEQLGHPLKAVRANLKGAIRKLCKLGLTQHVVTDAEVAAATAPLNPMDADQRERHNRTQREKKGTRREKRRTSHNAKLLADLEAVRGDGVVAAMLRAEDDTRVIVAGLLDGSFTVDDAVELIGKGRKPAMRELRGIIRRARKAGAAPQVR